MSFGISKPFSYRFVNLVTSSDVNLKHELGSKNKICIHVNPIITSQHTYSRHLIIEKLQTVTKKISTNIVYVH